MNIRKALNPSGGMSFWLAAITACATLALIPADAFAQKKALFIGAAAGDPTAGTDQIVFDHLEEKYGEGNVTYMAANQSDGSEADDVDIVLMSSTFGSGDARGKFHETTTPVFQWEEALVDQPRDGNWPFTEGGRTKSIEESFVILNLEHPIITAGSELHPGGLPVNEVGEEYQIFEDGGGNTWSAAGPLPEDAVILAETPAQYDPDLPIEESGACLFLVEPGGTLYESGGEPYVAAGPSLHFAMEDNSPGSFTDTGWALFDRCLDWLTGDLAGGDSALVGWYTFDDGAGETVADSSGAGHDGVIMGEAPEWEAEGKFGGALFLPGTDEFVEIADTEDHEFAEDQPFSVAVWLKSDLDDNDNGFVTKGYHDDSRDPNYWMLQSLGEGFGFDSRCCDGGGTPRIKPQAGGDSDDDEWHHFAVVRDIEQDMFFLYLDGEETGVLEMEIEGGNWDMGINDDPTVIGNHFNRFTPSFFDDLGIWRRALTPDEIVEIMERGIASIAGPGGPALFQITKVTHTEGEPAKLAITWNSKDRETYTIAQSSDLQTWLELTDGLESGGDSTSFEVELLTPETSEELYLRVTKEE